MRVTLVKGLDLARHGALLESMFRARARFYDDRLCRDVHVDDRGWEIDELDGDDALYIVLGDSGGGHLASLRLLPSEAKTALNDAFISVVDGAAFENAAVWECTRLMVDAVDADTTHAVTAQLLLALCETAQAAGIRLVTGAFDAQTLPILARAGWRPELVGQSGQGREAVYLGYWHVDESNADALRKAGDLHRHCLDEKARRVAASLTRPGT